MYREANIRKIVESVLCHLKEDNKNENTDLQQLLKQHELVMSDAPGHNFEIGHKSQDDVSRALYIYWRGSALDFARGRTKMVVEIGNDIRIGNVDTKKVLFNAQQDVSYAIKSFKAINGPIAQWFRKNL